MSSLFPRENRFDRSDLTITKITPTDGLVFFVQGDKQIIR